MAVTALAGAGVAQAHGPLHESALDPAAFDSFGPTTGESVFDRPLAAAAAGPVPTTVATILSVSDFHGRLNPEAFRIDLAGEKFGGAAYLQTHFKRRAELSPTPPFLVTQGDAVGATQPVSNLLGDRPTIDVMNAMGFDADTLGNHNFDFGVAHMRDLARAADFPYVVTNLTGPNGQRLPWTKRWAIWEVDGVRIGVLGAINEDAPSLLNPGLMGKLQIQKPTASVLNQAAAELRAQGVRTIIVLAHWGADPTKGDTNGASGPLIDLAKDLEGVDLVLGDHTYWQVNQPVVAKDDNVVWVVQSVPNGATFSEAKLTISRLDGEALAVTANQLPVKPAEVAADPEIGALVKEYNDEVEHIVKEQIGSSTEPMPINDGMSESLQGNVVTDALRAATGAQISIINSGGLRSGLTDSDNCTFEGCIITRGDVYGMLPFGNRTAVVTITEDELKTMLENGVSEMPTPAARFPQISGFSFRWRQTAPKKSRVVSATLADGTVIKFDADPDDPTYTLATNDFMAFGGDSYPPFTGRITFGNPMEEDVIAYLRAHPNLDPPGPPGDEARIVKEL